MWSVEQAQSTRVVLTRVSSQQAISACGSASERPGAAKTRTPRAIHAWPASWSCWTGQSQRLRSDRPKEHEAVWPLAKAERDRITLEHHEWIKDTTVKHKLQAAALRAPARAGVTAGPHALPAELQVLASRRPRLTGTSDHSHAACALRAWSSACGWISKLCTQGGARHECPVPSVAAVIAQLEPAETCAFAVLARHAGAPAANPAKARTASRRSVSMHAALGTHRGRRRRADDMRTLIK